MYTELRNLVNNNLDGDRIAKSFLNKKVKLASDCIICKMFQTEDGTLFCVYNEDLK